MILLEKDKILKKYLISIFIILTIAMITFSFMGTTEAVTNEDTSKNSQISKNLKIKNVIVFNNTKNCIKGVIEKSKNGTTIYLKKGVYKFNNTNIKINKTLTIIGKGSAKYVVIDARKNGRIFNIQKNGNLKLINITLKNGFGSGTGGVIYNKGLLSINKCIFIKNDAGTDGIDIFGFGGTIYNKGSLNLRNSIFKESKADFGVSIYCSSKYPIYISKCSFINDIKEYKFAILNDYTGNSPKIMIKDSYFKNFGIINFNDNVILKGNKFTIYSNSKYEYTVIENMGKKVNISYNTIKSVGKHKNLESAIHSLGSDYNNIYCNNIHGTFEFGISVDGIKNKIYKNQLYGNNKGYIGINLYPESKYNIISKNTVIGFKNGIYTYKGLKTNKISYNKLIKNIIALSSSYTFKNKSNIFKGNKINIKKIKDINIM